MTLYKLKFGYYLLCKNLFLIFFIKSVILTGLSSRQNYRILKYGT